MAVHFSITPVSTRKSSSPHRTPTKNDGKMRNYILKLIFLCVVFSVKTVAAGTVYYCDLNKSANGNGTYESPFQWSQLNSYPFSTGDDLYFKTGSSITLSAGSYLEIDWEGSPGDHVIIGAYYGDGQFGLNGENRPSIDGNNNTAPAKTSYRGIIDKQEGAETDAYLEIENLAISESGYQGVRIFNCNYVAVRDCRMSYCYKSGGIFLNSCKYQIVTGNILHHNRDGDKVGRQGGIVITSNSSEGSGMYAYVADNLLYQGGWEGIGVYQKFQYAVVENNVLYDIPSYHIYNDSSAYVCFRNNICYTSTEGSSYGAPDRHFNLNVEAEREYCYTGPTVIYNNLSAYPSVGISVACSVTNVSGYSNCAWESLAVFNNIIIDANSYSIYNNHTNSNTGIAYKNNSSWIPSAGGSLVNSVNPTNVTWSHNQWGSNPGGNAATMAVIGTPGIEKTSDWTKIAPGGINKDWFAPSSESSILVDAGTYLTTVTTTGSGTSLVVADAKYFFGQLSVWDITTEGSLIGVDNDQNGTIDFEAEVAAVNYSTNTLTIDHSNSFTSGGYVYIKNGSGDRFRGGDGIDIGTVEYGTNQSSNSTHKVTNVIVDPINDN